MTSSVDSVVGHDPGTEFGISVIRGDGTAAVSSGKLRRDGTERLLELWDYVSGVVEVHEPSLYVIEGYSFGSRHGSAGAHSTGEMGGVIRMCCAAYQVPLLVVAPTSLRKFITGSGKATGDKAAAAVQVYKRWGVECTSSHAAESYGLARIGFELLNASTSLTKAQREVIDTYGEKIDNHGQDRATRRRVQLPHRLQGIFGKEARREQG